MKFSNAALAVLTMLGTFGDDNNNGNYLVQAETPTGSGELLNDQTAYQTELGSKPSGIPYIDNPNDWEKVDDTDEYKSASKQWTVSASSGWNGGKTHHVANENPQVGMDGNPTSLFHTGNMPKTPGLEMWFQVDLGVHHDISSVAILNQHNIESVLNGAVVQLLDDKDNVLGSATLPGEKYKPGVIRYAWRAAFDPPVHGVEKVKLLQTTPESGCVADTRPEGGGSSCSNWINFHELNIAGTPNALETKDPSASGEPHFVTWSGEKYDFQGGCDLVLLQNPNFANGLGMNIHIRTSIRKWWSFIETAVVQIGRDTLEVKGSANDGATVWINHDLKMDLQTGHFSLGDYPVQFKRVNGHHTSARIDIGNGDAVSVESFKDFVRVNVHNKSNKSFDGSRGLLGAYPSGEKIGRDGKTVIDDKDAFGQEWMVLSKEPKLFHSESVVEGDRCTMPNITTSDMRRRLAEGSVSEEDAKEACSRVDEEQRDACIFDVLATQDKDMAGSY